MRLEFFDVVDERDEVTGHMLRAEVHRRGLRHRAVHVLVFNRRGRLFLQKRSMNKDQHPGVWDSSASGHVDAGETYDVAATRELREELGCTPGVPLRRLFKLDACKETGWEFLWVYRCEAEGPFTLHPEEIETGDWFTPRQITRRVTDSPNDFAPGFRFIWRTLQVRGLTTRGG